MKYNNLHQVYLDQQNLTGFSNFINAWIYADAHKAFVVDPGPLSTIPVLLDALERHGIRRLDYILLTHIHIDHAGGTGELVRHFPHTRVICHPAGIKHMRKPQSLWEGSLKVLGKVASEYGEIIPVLAENISFEPTLDDLGIKVLQTPGHAPHHLSFMFDDLLIAGEVAGVCCETPAGVYMRPATPPRFDLDIALDSLHKVKHQQPSKIIFAHSTLQDNAMHWLRQAEQQLHLWVRGVAGLQEKAIYSESEALNDAMYTWLLQHDSLFALIQTMPEEIHQREKYFLSNSIKGMSEYVSATDKTRLWEILNRVGSDI